MKCPSPWPFPKSHWICSQCNLDCILVPFCHCSTNPFPPLSRRYQIWSEKLHWTEWAKTVIVINVSCFWPHFKRQGSVGYGSAFFFFFFAQFSQIHVFWKANASLHLPGFAQMQTSGRDSLERSSFAFSYHIPRGCCSQAAISSRLLNTYLWLSIERQREGESPVINSPDH